MNLPDVLTEKAMNKIKRQAKPMHILLLAILFVAIAVVVLGTYPWPWIDID
jgi:hypothetical protein